MTDLQTPPDMLDRRALLQALRLFRKGDFSVRLPMDLLGIDGEIAQAFNDIAEMNESLADELARVREEVGKEGLIRQRARLPAAGGAWGEMTATVNGLIDDLVWPIQQVGQVAEAVAKGDLSGRMALEVDNQPLKGEFLRLGKTVNAMVETLKLFTNELGRVRQGFVSDGAVGRKMSVDGLMGLWKTHADQANALVSEIGSQMREITEVMSSLAKGDLSKKVTVEARGDVLELKTKINATIELLTNFATEVSRVTREVGNEGRLGVQAQVPSAAGIWKDLTDSVNVMAANIADQVRSIAEVTTAVAKGNLSKKITVDAKGEILALKNTMNTMVDQLNGFASEVSRVAREVGTEGKLGGQARVEGVAGTWKDLTDNVNSMAANLTGQVRNIAEVTTAVAKGDLSKKITVDVKGEILELKSTINTMVDQLNGFASEVSRVAREVGTDGRLGGQAQVPGVAGTWKDLTDNVNAMAANLTGQVRNIAEVTTAVARGDLSKKITVNVKGEILELKSTINTMVDQLNGFASEVSRVAREVGSEGKLGGQAQVPGVAGTWKDLTDNVNLMAANLTGQVRNIAEVTTAVARGDLSKKITVDVKGEILELKNTINTMVDQLNGFASEVSRVAREVGTEGRLGGQAQVPGVAGTWKDLTDNVNAMAANLTGQVRNIAEVTTAVAKGDLSKKITVNVKGEILELKSTINTMVDQLNGFASEVSRVAREVGTEGRLGGQAQVPGVAGTWKDLTDNVNAMAANLTGQVRNIAEVTTAVAKGDLSKKITVNVKGEILELKSTINTMVDQLNAFASEVSRVSREVGTEGKLGGQAQVHGVAGTWKDLTDNVNAMAANLTSQVRNIAEVTTAVAKGDLSKKIGVDVKGEMLELKNTINTMVDQLNGFASEVSRVAREVGTEGRLGGQAQVSGVAGTWKDLTDNVNLMAANLTGQVRNIAEVTTAVAKGDLSKKITVDVKGEILELKSTINTMVDQLNAFASEVSRVAREVGTEGKLGGQAQVHGVAGTWKDLTDNVNSMAANLTDQVRGIAQVVTAVAQGDLRRKVVFEAKGEIAVLADTINGMIDTLATLADQVTNVAREVGIEGKLGGQARVPGAAGLWRDLAGNVNELAANLTNQVRAISEVATAVTKGDLTRSITVEAMGEVAALKDNINEMIGNLKDTTLKNTEQDWLKTNLARFTRLLQGHGDLGSVSRLVLSELAPLVNAQQGVFYWKFRQSGGDEECLQLLASYASKSNKHLPRQLTLGEGLIGQCALEKRRILLEDVPHDYLRVSSVLGSAKPVNVVMLPVLFEGEVKAVIELASYRSFSETHLSFLDQLTESIGIVLNTIEANERTENLLEQSQSLTRELQSQQEELKKTNDRLEQQAQTLQDSEAMLKRQQEELQLTNEQLQEKARMLSEQMRQVEYKNKEVEQARRALEEKAEQLALSSRYKSEFLANMSHELRTPLNSLLILAKLLADNAGKNLLPKQIDYAQTIYSAGTDLLSLINDILDLAKIESGTVTLTFETQSLVELSSYVEQNFRQVAQDKRLGFEIVLAPDLPPAIHTDVKRLEQILKNLLSNAFKFTQQGKVELRIANARAGELRARDRARSSEQWVMFTVTDTGIGIPENKQRIIFEAFQQADGTTSREYGGTGLGLSISRELTRLLGGEIRLSSAPGVGSSFTLFLPVKHEAADVDALQAPLRTPPQLPAPARSDVLPDAVPVTSDDRDSIRADDRIALIVEHDDKLAALMLDLVRGSGFKGVVAADAGSALGLVRELEPDAITLDPDLPDMDGWSVLELLKSDPETRQIPVNIVRMNGHAHRCFQIGALGIAPRLDMVESLREALDKMRKLRERDIHRLLVADTGQEARGSIAEALRGDDVEITVLKSGEQALEAFDEGGYDCMVLGPRLEDMDVIDLVRKITESDGGANVPLVIYGLEGRAAARAGGMPRVSAEVAVIKRAERVEEILRETTLFLHQTVDNLPPTKRDIPSPLQKLTMELSGKKVLIVDDDIRNIYAMTGALEQHGMLVAHAENGKEGLETLKNNPDVDVVLMDIMMPELDGYDTIRIIRGLDEYAQLPVIAVTAKAMKGDREKCLEAGASDYISKPVNVEQLLSLLRVWLVK